MNILYIFHQQQLYIYNKKSDNKNKKYMSKAQKQKNKQSAQYYLLFKLQQIQIRNRNVQDSNQILYFSISQNDKLYFSSCILTYSKVNILSDDIIIPIYQKQLPQNISMQRWQNHMVMYEHQIDISQLKNRTTTKKKHQTKNGQILSFMIILLNQQQIRFGDQFVPSITQHYLIVQQIKLTENKQNISLNSPSFFTIKTANSDYIMPVVSGELCIQLPETFTFQYTRNGKIVGKSKVYNSQILQNNSLIKIISDKGQQIYINLKLKWCINFFQAKTQNTLLLQAHQLFIYDIQIKFDAYNEYANAKVKFVYGSKGFEVANQFTSSKPNKIKKIVYFIIKSQDQQISIIVQKNLNVVAQSRFFTDQIISYKVNNNEMKILNNNGKSIGVIKFKCEKAKSLSTPNNNRFWKDSKKKINNTILLSIQQISIQYQKQDQICIIIKTQEQQRILKQIPNFKYFNRDNQVSCVPFVVQAKPQQNVYLMIKNAQDNLQQPHIQNDFIGIAILNFNQLRLGANSTQILFFKNQKQTCISNCIINKVIPFPFVKPVFQPQILNLGTHRTINISIFIKKAVFTPYFHTFRYENKNQVYCIVEVNKMKKVLIMQAKQQDQLYFQPTLGSDNPNFYIQQSDYIKIKITFLVSDLGSEQQIFGSTLIKIKQSTLISNGNNLVYNKIQLKNQFGIIMGDIAIQVNAQQQINKYVNNGSYNNINNNNNNNNNNISNNNNLSIKNKVQTEQVVSTGPFKSQIRQIKNSLQKVNKDMEQMQLSIKKKGKYSSPIPTTKTQQKASNGSYKASQRYISNNKKKFPTQKQIVRERKNYSMGASDNNVKLPHIKEAKDKDNKKNNLQDLVNRMKIRKRDMKGFYQQNSTVIPFQARYPTTERVAIYENKAVSQQIEPFSSRLEKQSRDSFKIQKQSYGQAAQTQRSVHLQKKQNMRKQIEQYQEKLKGLKNAYKQMHGNQNNQSLQNDSIINKLEIESQKKNPPQLEDNEFARLP